MDDRTEFAVSSNGDRWFLEHDLATGETVVLHRGNPPSGEHETRLTIDAFLAQCPCSPERDALSAKLASRLETAEDQRGGPDAVASDRAPHPHGARP